jgi:hypothetical protein
MLNRLHLYQITGKQHTWLNIEIGSTVLFVNVKTSHEFKVHSITFYGKRYNNIKQVFADMQPFDSVRDCLIITTTGIKLPLNRLTYANTSTI